MNGLPISTPYLTKDYLQQKRFQAQSNGTTYVYDIPDMFRQMTERLWKEYLKLRPHVDTPIPQKVLLDCVELVLVGDTLEEVKRLPGENNVSWLEEIYKVNYLKLVLLSVCHGGLEISPLHTGIP